MPRSFMLAAATCVQNMPAAGWTRRWPSPTGCSWRRLGKPVAA